MDERSPLENRSLTHTSKEPEGQAWAQIGASKPKGSTTKGDMPFTAKEATGAKGEATATSETESKSSPSKATAEKNNKKDATAAAPLEQKEDAVNEEELQLVENADGDHFAVDTSVEEKESGKDEGKKEKEDKSAESPDKSKDASKDTKKGSDDDSDDGKARTNSNNPWMIRSRVFVGHLNTEKCSRKEIEDLFDPYGKVVGCSLQHGYGFVQYDEEESAKRAIRELHGLQFKGMKLVVDKTAALKKMLGENPSAPRPWNNSRDRSTGGPRHHRYDDTDYFRRRDFGDRYTRLEELERMYYDRYPAVPPRDPYYDRIADRYPSPPPRDPYYERYRHSEMDRGRYYDRYSHHNPMGGYDRHYYDRPYDHPDAGYERPRDDPYDRRERDKDLLRDREPFERFEASRRL